MANVYSEQLSNRKLEPKDETISFLLNYSKALSVINYERLQFESFLN